MNKVKALSKALKSKTSTGLAILEALERNDPQAVIAAIADYLKSKNKSRAAKKGNLARSTLYLNMAKDANPTLKTLAKVIYACTVSEENKV